LSIILGGLKYMKIKLLTLFIILALSLGGVMPASAQSAYDTAFTTSITYQNVDTSATTSLQVLFYATPTSTDPIVWTPPTQLAAGAGTSIFIGNLGNVDPGFRGTAIMQSDRRLVATLVQVPMSDTVKNRPLSNGFDSGAPDILLATVLKNVFQTNSIFAVQNTDNQSNNVTIRFYNTDAVNVHNITTSIASGAGYYVDAGQVPELGPTFNGSAVVEARRTDNSMGSAVATVMELSVTGTGALAFESVDEGSMTYYMPSAICNAFGGQNSSYAVQNTNLTTATDVTVSFSNGVTQTKNVGPGAKASFPACDVPGMPAGFSGSAVVTSATTDIVAMGKIYGAGLSTGFIGAPSGASKLALPYVRWSETQYFSGQRQRTFIALQNVGENTIPAGSITISYRDRNGNEIVAHPVNQELASGAKFNSNPFFNQNPGAAEFGYYADGFGGGAIVECTAANCELAVIARVQSWVPATNNAVAEDYNGIPAP
jgi:hypothetical protein